jgi:hypothetical protein
MQYHRSEDAGLSSTTERSVSVADAKLTKIIDGIVSYIGVDAWLFHF